MGWEVGESGDVLMLQNTVFLVVEWEGYKVPCQSDVSLAPASGSTHSHNVMHFCKSLSLSLSPGLKVTHCSKDHSFKSGSKPSSSSTLSENCIRYSCNGWMVEEGEKNLE